MRDAKKKNLTAVEKFLFHFYIFLETISRDALTLLYIFEICYAIQMD